MWTNLNMVSLFKSLLCTLHKVNIFYYSAGTLDTWNSETNVRFI